MPERSDTPAPSEEDLQTALQAEAMEIVSQLSLLDCLKGLGEARVVGSVALGLIVKKDIDIHVVVEKGRVVESSDAVYHTLLASPKVREIRITDYRRDKSALKNGLSLRIYEAVVDQGMTDVESVQKYLDGRGHYLTP